jgi:hypothetical protein
VRLAAGEIAISGGERRQGVCGPGRAAEQVTLFLEADRDKRRDQGLLVAEVFIDRRRAHPDPVTEATHRQPVWTILLEQVARCANDLLRPRREPVQRPGS